MQTSVRQLPDKETLVHLYHDEKLKIATIAKIYGYSRQYILMELHRHKIPIITTKGRKKS